MKIYKVYMDLSSVILQLRNFKLETYNNAFPIIFVSASDPDDACHKALSNLATIIFKQDQSNETIKLFKELSYGIKILQLYTP